MAEVAVPVTDVAVWLVLPRTVNEVSVAVIGVTVSDVTVTPVAEVDVPDTDVIMAAA